MTITCTVTAAQLRELRALLRRRTTPVGHARRARVIVLTAEGRSGAEIASMVGIAPGVVECIVPMALSAPPAGRKRWTTRLIGDAVDLTSATVAKVLRANGLKPHLVRTYKVSRDPEFAAKVIDVVGLYTAL